MAKYTSKDLREELDQVLDACDGPHDFDREAIVAEVQKTYGTIPIGTIGESAFWSIVQKHDRSQKG